MHWAFYVATLSPPDAVRHINPANQAGITKEIVMAKKEAEAVVKAGMKVTKCAVKGCANVANVVAEGLDDVGSMCTHHISKMFSGGSTRFMRKWNRRK